MIPQGKIVFYLIQLLQKVFKKEAWLLAHFFMCLHNQFICIISIVISEGVQVFGKGDSSNVQKMNGHYFQQILGKI